MKQFLPTKAGAVLLLALSLVTQINFSQTPTLQFSGTFETQHEHGVWSRATVTDSNGNFYMTGLYHGTVDFDISSGSFPLTYQGGPAGSIDGEADVYVAKYNPGGELIWVRNLEEPTFVNMNEERGSAMIVDENNNLYLTGFTSTRGFFVSKWNTNGDEIWTKYFDDTEDVNPVTTFALRKKGNSILISGVFVDVLDFDPSDSGTTELTSVNNDGFLLSLSDDGNFEWVKQFRCNGGVIITGLEVDASNNIFLSGIFLGTVDLNPDTAASVLITSQSVSTAAISSAFLAKYNSNGELLWNRHLRGSSTTDFFMTFIKKDTEDNIIVTGSFKGLTAFLPTTTSMNTGSFYSCFLAKYSNDGNLQWTKNFGNPTGNQGGFFPSSFCANVLTDNCNNIYVSGEFGGNCDFNPSADENILSTPNNLINAFVAAYDSSGEHQWSTSVGGLGNVTFVEFNGYLPIALDNNNDVIFTGTFRMQLDLDPSPTGTALVTSSSTNPNIAGVFIAKYDNPINVCTLSNNDFEESKFTVYPNPSNGLVTLSVKGIEESAVVNVYDISGKRLLSKKIDVELTTLDLGNFTKGIYIIELNNGSKTSHQKLILQ